jgi:hypothetical protein
MYPFNPYAPVYGGSLYDPATRIESRDLRPLSFDDPRYSQRLPLQQPGMMGGMPNRPTNKLPPGMDGIDPVIMDGDGGMRPPGYPPQTGGTTPLPFEDSGTTVFAKGPYRQKGPAPTQSNEFHSFNDFFNGTNPNGGMLSHAVDPPGVASQAVMPPDTTVFAKGPYRQKGPAPTDNNFIGYGPGVTEYDSNGVDGLTWEGPGNPRWEAEQRQQPPMRDEYRDRPPRQQRPMRGGFGQQQMQQMNPFMGGSGFGGYGGFGQQQMNPFMGGFGGFNQQMNPFMGGGFGGFGGGFGQQQMNPFMGGGGFNPFMGGGFGGFGQQMQNPFMGGSGFGGQQMQQFMPLQRGGGQMPQLPAPQQQPMQQQQPMGYQGGAF